MFAVTFHQQLLHFPLTPELGLSRFRAGPELSVTKSLGITQGGKKNRWPMASTQSGAWRPVWRASEGRRRPVPADPERPVACGQATHLSICLPRTQTTYFHKGLWLMTSLFVSQPITARNGGRLLPVLSQMEEEMQRTVEQQTARQPGKWDARVTPPFPGTKAHFHTWSSCQAGIPTVGH